MCPTPSASGVMVALTGCTAKLGWGLSYCGAIVDRAGPDFLSTSINERSLEYPRILVPGSMVNGDQEPEISCGEGITCRNICENFARTARIGNLPVSSRTRTIPAATPPDIICIYMLDRARVRVFVRSPKLAHSVIVRRARFEPASVRCAGGIALRQAPLVLQHSVPPTSVRPS